jgi:ribosome-binding protein aMBF1 (putative translation factor)
MRRSSTAPEGRRVGPGPHRDARLSEPARLRLAGEAIRSGRRRTGLSQQLLGLMTGTTQQTVSRWEKGLGAPEPTTQRALVEILGLPAGLWSTPRRRRRSAVR